MIRVRYKFKGVDNVTSSYRLPKGASIRLDLERSQIDVVMLDFPFRARLAEYDLTGGSWRILTPEGKIVGPLQTLDLFEEAD